MFSTLIAGGLLTAITALVGAGINAYSQHKTNQVNQEINQANIDYNTAQTQQAWERDDTAHQREVADLEAAGLSPLAATGGLNVNAPIGAPSPIAMQAPQIDTNALVQGLLGAAQTEETRRHNLVTEQNRTSELQIEAEKVTQQAEALDIENKKVESEIKYYSKLNELEAQKIDEVIRSNKKSEDIKLTEHEQNMLEYQSKMFLAEIEKQTGGTNIPYYEVYDLEVYANAKKLYNLRLDNFIKKIGATQSANASSISSSAGGNAGINAAGTGANIGANASNASSEYSMQNMSEKQQKMWYQFLQENKCPVYIDKSKYNKLYK